MKRRNNSIQETEQRQLLVPGITSTIQNTADAAKSFAQADYTRNGQQAQKCRITVNTNDVTFAEGIDPSANPGHQRVQGDEFWLNSPEDIADFQFTNTTGTQQVTLAYTMYYRKEG